MKIPYFFKRKIHSPVSASSVRAAFVVISVCSLLSAAAVYALTRGMKVVIIAQTKVSAQPVADFLWPVLALAVLISTAVCAAAVGYFYFRSQRDFEVSVKKFKNGFHSMSVGDFTKPIDAGHEGKLYPVAVEAEKMREDVRRRLIGVRDRHNAVKNFLDQKNFEVNAQNRELLKQKLKDLDDHLKSFNVAATSTSSASPFVSIRPQSDKVIQDAEEMLKA